MMMQHLTTEKTYQFYEKTHRLKTMQSMEEKSQQRKSIEEQSKQHGIDVAALFEERVLSNKQCFWSLLQSQTDRMHHYYHQEEKYIFESLTSFERTGLLSPALLEQLRKDVMWLQDFVTFNIDMFEMAVSEFDAEHRCDTFGEEMEYFEEQYPFTNRKRLKLILEAIDMFLLDFLEHGRHKHHHFNLSHKEHFRVFKRSSIVSRPSREKSKDAVRRLSGVIHEDANKKSIQKKKFKFLRFILRRKN